MILFILRRLVQMVPTVLGVIVVTFILFNVVGGSPARMKLGDKASAQALEDFDEQRGFNKPLILGRRGSTRAWSDHDLAAGPGPWVRARGAVYQAAVDGQPARLLWADPGAVEVPLAFPLRAGANYEWSLRWRPAGQGEWRRAAIACSGEQALASLRSAVGEGAAEVAELRLRRLTAHAWDSQLVFFLRQLARFDLGVSSSANQPVVDLLREGIGPTLGLTVPILALETVLSLALAMLCAFFRDRLADRILVVVSVALMSVNYLVWIVAGQYLLAYRLGWFPVWGFASWTYLLLPIGIGAFSGLGGTLRFYRTVLLDEMYKDYVRTAWAKGLGTGAVMFRHVLRNALIPVITNVALSIPFLYTGSLLLESFFGIPGLGYLGVNAINDSDVDVVRAIVVVGSMLYLAANLLADLCYAWVDPRVRLT